ncbi:hypothetical protein SAMN05428975_4673 [Mucilaginibacter sp. OK268]|uniref:hypothetical protein n=1 Tax=Mucilaginibacter sp. OK268 TaxID=1881048 RepID=UPI00087E2F9E|nr:hypothetical protein [Mucilaginibacter sp. OK268]SDP98244.1 hypothetical protein SAMN05428975_4673 [Mucilaginibacter sp. OK268]
MSKKKGSYSFRLNLDELTPEELFEKMKKLQNEALKEAGESISGGAGASVSVIPGNLFSRSVN